MDRFPPRPISLHQRRIPAGKDQLSINDVRHYTPADDAVLSTEIIEDQTLNKLNRLKKVNTEAFFYCRRLEDLG